MTTPPGGPPSEGGALIASRQDPPTRTELPDQWALLLHCLPPGWEDAAWTYGAITPRRVIDGAESLLRLVFAYAWNDWSLRVTAAWAGPIGLGDLSDVAVLKPLGHQVAQGFQHRGIGTTVTTRGRVVITDGSTIQRPGSFGTTWRLHAPWHLGTGRGEPITLTDAHGAESLTRLTLHPHDVVLADRNDARPAALAAVVDQQADLVVRFGWNALRWETPTGTPWGPLDAVRTLPEGTPGDWAVQLPVGKTHAPLRLRVVAIRKSPTATEHARRQARQSARRHGHTVAAATLEAAAYVLLLTTLPPAGADAAEILELYRLRWPIACAFKRLKSLIHLDALRAFDPDLPQTYLLAKVLGALLVDDLHTRGPAFSPCGYPPRVDVARYLAEYPDVVARPPRHHPRPR